MPTRRPMHGLALGHLDNQRAAAHRPRRRHPEQIEIQRRLHAVRTDLGHEVRQRIQLRGVESLRPALVGHAEDEPPTAAVGQRCQPVGQVVSPGPDDPVSAEASSFSSSSVSSPSATCRHRCEASIDIVAPTSFSRAGLAHARVGGCRNSPGSGVTVRRHGRPPSSIGDVSGPKSNAGVGQARTAVTMFGLDAPSAWSVTLFGW